MIKFLVTANGHNFGYFKAETAKAACDMCAQEAGYKDEADAAENIGMTDLVAEADSFRNSVSNVTCPEIVEAILFLAGGDDELAMKIWDAESPSKHHDYCLAIWEIVTGNGLRPSTDYYWGDEDNRWAAHAGIEG